MGTYTTTPHDIPAEAAHDQYIRKLLTIANETKSLKGAPFVVEPRANAICHRMASEVHKSYTEMCCLATAM